MIRYVTMDQGRKSLELVRGSALLEVSRDARVKDTSEVVGNVQELLGDGLTTEVGP